MVRTKFCGNKSFGQEFLKKLIFTQKIIPCSTREKHPGESYLQKTICQ